MRLKIFATIENAVNGIATLDCKVDTVETAETLCKGFTGQYALLIEHKGQTPLKNLRKITVEE